MESICLVTGTEQFDLVPQAGVQIAYGPVQDGTLVADGNGNWPHQYPAASFATTNAQGQWAIPLPYGGTATYPSTAGWFITPSSGITYAGVVPSVLGPLTLFDLVNSYGWGVIPSGAAQPELVQGPGFAARGVYSSTTTYAPYDLVLLNGTLYSCTSPVTGGAGPGVDTAHWSLFFTMTPATSSVAGVIETDAAQTGTAIALTPNGFLADAYQPWLLAGGAVSAVLASDYTHGVSIAALSGWFPKLAAANRAALSAPTTIGLPATSTALQTGGDTIIYWQGGSTFVTQFQSASVVNAGTPLTPPANSILLARVTVSATTVAGTYPITVVTDVRQMRSYLGGRAYLDPVSDFGADPTGNLDCTAAIQACINVAVFGLGPGWIHFRDGTFRIDGQLFLPSWIAGTYQNKSVGIKITGVTSMVNSIGSYLTGGTIWDMRWDGGFGVNTTALGPFSGHTAVDSSAGISPITYVNGDAIPVLGTAYKGFSVSTTGNNYLNDYAVVSGLWLTYTYDFFARTYSGLSLSRGAQDSNRAYINNATPTDLKSIPDPGTISSGSISNYLKSPQAAYALKWFLDVDASGNVYATQATNWTTTTCAIGTASSTVQASPAPTTAAVTVGTGAGSTFASWIGKTITIGGVAGTLGAVAGDVLSLTGFASAPTAGQSVTVGLATSTVQASPAPSSGSVTLATGDGAKFTSFAGYAVTINGHTGTITGITGDTLSLAGFSYVPVAGDAVSQYAYVPQTSSTLIAGPGTVGSTYGVNTSALPGNLAPAAPNTIRTWALWVDSGGNVIGVQDVRNRVRKFDCRAFGTINIQGISLTRGRAGAYNGNTTYHPGQWALASGGTWRATQVSTGQNPTADFTGTNWVRETTFQDMVPMLGFNNTYAIVRDNVFAGPVKASSGWFPNIDCIEFGGGLSPLAKLITTGGAWGQRVLATQESVTAGGQLMGTGSMVDNNYFDGIRRGAWFRSAANQCKVRGNYFGKGCGDDLWGAAVVLEGPSQFTSPSQVSIADTVLEATYYTQGHLWSYACNNNQLTSCSSTDAWAAALSGSRATPQTGTTLQIQPAHQSVDVTVWKGAPLLVGQNQGNGLGSTVAGAAPEFVVMDPTAPVSGSTFQSQGLNDYSGNPILDASSRIHVSGQVNWTQVNLPVQLPLSTCIIIGDGIASQEIVTTSGSAVPSSNGNGTWLHTLQNPLRLTHTTSEIIGTAPFTLTVKGQGPAGVMLYPHGGTDTVSHSHALLRIKHGPTTTSSWPDAGGANTARDNNDSQQGFVLSANGSQPVMTALDEVYYYTGTTTTRVDQPGVPNGMSVIPGAVHFVQAPSMPSLGITAGTAATTPLTVKRAAGQTADMIDLYDSDGVTALAGFGPNGRLGYPINAPPQVFLGAGIVGSAGIPDPAPAPGTPTLSYGNGSGFAMTLGDTVWAAMSWTNAAGETQCSPPVQLTASQTDTKVNIVWPVMTCPTTGTPLTAKFYASATTNAAIPVQGTATWTGLGATGITTSATGASTVQTSVTALGAGAAPISQPTTVAAAAWSWPINGNNNDMQGDVSLTAASTGTFATGTLASLYYRVPFATTPYVVVGWGSSSARSAGIYKQQSSSATVLNIASSIAATTSASIRASYLTSRNS